MDTTSSSAIEKVNQMIQDFRAGNYTVMFQTHVIPSSFYLKTSVIKFVEFIWTRCVPFGNVFITPKREYMIENINEYNDMIRYINTLEEEIMMI